MVSRVAGGRRAGQLGDAMGRGLVRAHVVRVLRRADVLQVRTLVANLVFVQKDVWKLWFLSAVLVCIAVLAWLLSDALRCAAVCLLMVCAIKGSAGARMCPHRQGQRVLRRAFLGTFSVGFFF